MTASATTVREALVAEMLADIDKLLVRVEQLDQALATKIEQASKDAMGQAFLSVKLNLESTVREQEHKLVQAGREAAARIGNELSQKRPFAGLGGKEKIPAVSYVLLLWLNGFAVGGLVSYLLLR